MLHTFGLSDGYRRMAAMSGVICKIIGHGLARCILYLCAYNLIAWLEPEGSKDLHKHTHTESERCYTYM